MIKAHQVFIIEMLCTRSSEIQDMLAHAQEDELIEMQQEWQEELSQIQEVLTSEALS